MIAVNLLAPMLARRLIDNPTWSSTGTITAVLLVAAYFLRGVLRAVSNLTSHIASRYTCAHISTQAYAHVQQLSRGFFAERHTGELMTRLTTDVDQVEALLSHALPDTVSNILLAVGVAAALFFINVPLAAITLVTILPVLAVGLFQKRINAAFGDMLQAAESQNTLLSENLQGIREIQLFNRQAHEGERAKGRFHAVARAAVRAIRWYSFLAPGVEFFTSLGQVVVVAAGGYMIAAGALTSGDVVAFLLYVGTFYGPVSALSNTLETIQKAAAGASRVLEALDQPVAIRGGTIRAGRLRGEIELRDVSFSYEGGEAVLEHLSLHIPAGQSVALIGSTGSGKTTLLNLIIRLFDPRRGYVAIDGVDIRDYTLESLRDNISIVSQDVFLFSGTIYDNIAYSKPDATPEEIRAAAANAAIHDFIAGLPQGYDTLVGEKGVKLSGGQRQRLAIARALLRAAPILLLDEATSAVDEATEREIRRAVMDHARGRTVLIVTHRLASLADVERVVTIEKGK